MSLISVRSKTFKKSMHEQTRLNKKELKLHQRFGFCPKVQQNIVGLEQGSPKWHLGLFCVNNFFCVIMLSFII